VRQGWTDTADSSSNSSSRHSSLLPNPQCEGTSQRLPSCRPHHLQSHTLGSPTPLKPPSQTPRSPATSWKKLGQAAAAATGTRVVNATCCHTLHP
jgi:hypothetical protein